MVELKRMWINQPSIFQPFHRHHGRNVLFDPISERVWFTEGDVISSDIPNINVLSPGWRVIPPTLSNSENKEG